MSGVLAALLALTVHIILIVAAAVYLAANRKPSSAIAWLLAGMLIPVIGILFFLLVGAVRLPKRRRDKQRFISEMIMARTASGLDKLSRHVQWLRAQHRPMLPIQPFREHWPRPDLRNHHKIVVISALASAEKAKRGAFQPMCAARSVEQAGTHLTGAAFVAWVGILRPQVKSRLTRISIAATCPS